MRTGPLPIAMMTTELDAHIRRLGRDIERAERQGRWQDAEAYRAELDPYERELAERGARSPEAMARITDAYDMDRAAVLVSVYERR